MKRKRIKALKYHIREDGFVTQNKYLRTKPCYVFRQSDVRALAEQFLADYWRNDETDVECMLRVFKLVGMTPGRARGGKS